MKLIVDENSHHRKPLVDQFVHWPTGGMPCESSAMKQPRDIVAANLEALIRYAKDHDRKDIATNLGIERASKAMHGDGHLTRTTIRDIRKRRRDTGIDTLQMLAEIFGTQAWVLLTPHPKPDDLPVKPVTKTEVQLYKRLGKVAREYDELQKEQQREEGPGGPTGPDSETPRSIGDGTRDGSIRGDDD